MKKTVADLQKLNAGIEGLSHVKDVKFSFALMRNKKKIKKELDAAAESLTAFLFDDKEKKIFTEYDKERISIAKKHSKKEDGKPKYIKVGQALNYEIADQDAFDKEFEALTNDEKYKSVLERKKEIDEKEEEIKKQEVDIEFYKIKQCDLPTGEYSTVGIDGSVKTVSKDLSLSEIMQIEDLIDEE